MAPSLCGSFVTDKRSLIAFTWTITCVLTLAAFITGTVFLIHVHTSYKRLEHSYYEQFEYQQQQQQQQEGGEQQHSADRDSWEEFYQLASMRSGSLTFVAIYIVLVATTLSFYGSTAIVGFTSLRGVYIAPCFSSHDRATLTLKLGMFGGAIVFFANLLLICAVIFGEVRVEDWRNNRRQGENHDQQAAEQEPYEIERIATVLAVTCMFLAALYSIFAILLFLYFGSKENLEDDELNIMPGNNHPPTTLAAISIDPRREKFITLHEAAENYDLS